MNICKILKQHWAIFVILLIAAVLRFWRLEDLTTFGGDQGRDFLIVKAITESKFTLLGPQLGPLNQNGNVYLGPAYYYLIAPALFLFHLDPVGPSIIMVCLSLATLIMAYIIGVNFFSKKVAILTTSLLAFSALLIEQSRAALNPFPIPFFSAIFLFASFKLLIDKSKYLLWPILMGISSGVMFQLHYLTIALSLSSTIFLIAKRQYRTLAIILVVFLIIISPQIVFELRHNFFITHQILNRISTGNEISSPKVFVNQLLSVPTLISNLFFSQKYILSLLVVVLISLLILKKPKINFRQLYLLANIIFTFIFASLYSQVPQYHYFAAVYLSMALLIADLFMLLLSKIKEQRLNHLSIIVAICLFLVNAPNYQLNRSNGYTMPDGWNLKGIKNASKIVANDIDSHTTFNIAATLDGDTRAMPYRYLLSVYGKNPLNVEQYPQADVLYLISRDTLEQIKKYTVWEVASFRPYNIIKLKDIQNGVSVYKLTKI